MAPAARSITAATAIHTAGANSSTTTETDDVMPASPAPSIAHIATVTAFDLQAEPVRTVRLSARQHEALDGLQVPIPAPVSPAPLNPTTQVELVIQDAVARILSGRHVSAVLWRDPDLGDVSVWHDGEFLPIATVELTPARVAERAVA